MAMASLRTPIVACVIGEGGSGGALAIGVADRLLMLENSIYSVASPEASASILWRDAAQAPDAAQTMRITADDLFEFGIVDEVIAEPEEGAHTDPAATIAAIGESLRSHLTRLLDLPAATLLQQRYEKYRAIGCYQERIAHLLDE